MSKKTLLIVESPSKIKTIQKYLGKDYTVLASYGHIRDLGPGIGIDFNNQYKLNYEVIKGKEKVIKEIKKAYREHDTIYLATDNDREGEAIAYHIAKVLNLDLNQPNRIVFNEITKTALQNALNDPRPIDLNLVNAQQARRAIDRIVGFNVSPLLWKTIKPKLSAGRVQSPVLKLIIDHENHIKNTKQSSVYKVKALFNKDTDFTGSLVNTFKKEQEAYDFIQQTCKLQHVVTDITKKEHKPNRLPPFTTSALQKTAQQLLNYSIKKTMQIAQQLYEKGYITYMRTDSTHLSEEALKSIHNHLNSKNYPVDGYQYQTLDINAQEAHEAIRPTDIDKTDIPESNDLTRLYQLIHQRTLASQMPSPVLLKTVIKIQPVNTDYTYKVEGQILKEEGYYKVYPYHQKDKPLPNLNKGDSLNVLEIQALQSYKQLPYHFTEAKVVDLMEKLGIGRPSTYVATLTKLQERNYILVVDIEVPLKPYKTITYSKNTSQILIEKHPASYTIEKQKIKPTDLGVLVCEYLVDQVKEVTDVELTRKMEIELDHIARGERDYVSVIDDFYKLIQYRVNLASKDDSYTTRELGTDSDNNPITVHIGPYGVYIKHKDKTYQVKQPDKFKTLTLEEALDIIYSKPNYHTFKLSKKQMKALKTREYEIHIGEGKYGLYIRLGKQFYNVPADIDPDNVDVDTLVDIVLKQIEDKQKDMIGGRYLYQEGQYGPYIRDTKNKQNVSVPKGLTKEDLTVDKIKELFKNKKRGNMRFRYKKKR